MFNLVICFKKNLFLELWERVFFLFSGDVGWLGDGVGCIYIVMWI